MLQREIECHAQAFAPVHRACVDAMVAHEKQIVPIGKMIVMEVLGAGLELPE
jgi:hypothetical protein